MSKPSLINRIGDAFKRLFGRSTRPVVSSKPEDMAAADVPAKRAEGAVSETIPAQTADADAAAEFATEVVSSDEQRPTEPPEPIKPLETSKAPEAAAAPQQAPEEPLAEKKKEEEKKPAEATAKAESSSTEPSDAQSSPAEEKAAEQPAAASEEKAEPAADAEQAPAEAPLPNYDSLTLPSVRARLRKLTVDQVRQLRAYEAAHANRPEFVRMFDNRIKKLEEQQSAE